MANATALRIGSSDLDALWDRSEPDLELDQDGQIRQVPSAVEHRGSRLGAAAPIALGAIVSSVSRWD